MRYTQIKPLLEQTLTEINMSPSSLRKLASKINAKAGMEFEMIVPNAASETEEYEPDYNQDESVADISDACRFFHDGDYNGRREIERLRERMETAYYEWRDDKVAEEWDRNGFEFFVEWMDRNDSFEPLDYKESAYDYVLSNNPNLHPDSDEFDELMSERLRELEAEYYQESWDAQERNYDEAYDEFRDEQFNDALEESDWLDDVGLHAMSDIENEFSIQWPYWRGGDNGGRAIEDVADEFSRMIGRPVNHSTSYHGADREEGHYVVEPDGSLQPDESSDSGLEFVSPPLPIAELLSDLDKVKTWADENGCYTGSRNKTGLHINVSVDGWSGIENLDYVKLAILLGDDYVLKQFKRQSNSYCKGALGIVKDAIKSRPGDAKKLLAQMKQHMNTAASKLIHSGITNKFTSINTKDGYVEFRSPGGDWLDTYYDQIEPTLLRFVVALDAAVKPDLYKQEYQKKLYKLLEPAADEYGVMVKEFSDYVSGVGGAPEQVVKDFRRSAIVKLQQGNLDRKLAKDAASGKPYWWNVAVDGQRIEVVAKSQEEAWAKAVKERREWENKENLATFKPLRPYTGATGDNHLDDLHKELGIAGSDSNWGIWMIGADRFANQPGEYARGETPPLYRFPSKEAAEQWIEQQRAARPRMRTDIEVREIEPSQPAASGAREYEIFADGDPFTVVRSFYAADDQAAQAILDQYRQDHPGTYYREIGRASCRERV